MLPDTVPEEQPPGLLRRGSDGDHHGHELLPGGQVPLRPERHGVRVHGQLGPERQAPARRDHRHAVQAGAVQLPGPDHHLPRPARLQPHVPGRAHRAREQGRRRGAGGHHAEQLRPLGAHARVLGLHLEDRPQPPAPWPLLHAHHQRVRQAAGGQERHPGQLHPRRRLPLLRPVLMIELAWSLLKRLIVSSLFN
uniref:Uncharacterized protein n=1 Tax=Zea mays TaxID=4577 RepID=A0A804LN99_MAIZE